MINQEEDNNPYDDLNLACILRSPFYRLEDQLLEDICFTRKDSLYEELLRSELPEVKEIAQKLEEVFSAEFSSTREFFRKLILQVGFLWSYIKQYGSIIKSLYQAFFDVLDGAQASLSLQGFCCYLKNLDSGIESQPAIENKVRLMTIHASKGLEAKIVIIADIKSLTSSKENYFIHEDKFYYKMNHSFELNDFDNIRDSVGIEDEKEYFRLGYVALTRGKNELHMYGKKLKDDEPDHWHKTINKVMQDTAELEVKGEDNYYQLGSWPEFKPREKLNKNKLNDNKRKEYFDITFPELYYYTSESPSVKNDGKISPSPLSSFYSKVNYGSNYHKLLNIFPVAVNNKNIMQRYDINKSYSLLKSLNDFFVDSKNYYHELSFAKKEKKGYKFIISKSVVDLLLEKDASYEVVEFKSSASNINEFLLDAYNRQLTKYTNILSVMLTDKPVDSYLYFAKDNKKIYKKEVNYVD
jgi:ATP-dependent helicase/nuclease subunit A